MPPAGDAARDEQVLRRVDDGVCRITLNRPEAGNAITAAMRNRMVEWLEEASADLAVRAIVLTGSGEKGFCTGADLRSQEPGPPRPNGAPDRPVGEAARMIRNGWQRLITAILDCEKPVIAAVNATAAGGGMHLALACDLVLAAEEATFIEVFVRRGIAPDAGGGYLLPRLIGPQRGEGALLLRGRTARARGGAARTGQPGGAAIGAGRTRRRVGGAPGAGSDSGDRGGQVLGQPVA